MSTRIMRPAFIVTDSLRSRFFAKVHKNDDGCWIWTGSTNPNGYGKVRIAGRSVDTHVTSWRIANAGQPVPIGLVVMHSCDVRSCVNPDHLSLGTQSRNMTDASVKGRLDIRCGEQVHNAVLTDDAVRVIRARYAQGDTSGRRLAKELGLTYPIVRAVLQRRTWKHVESSPAAQLQEASP